MRSRPLTRELSELEIQTLFRSRARIECPAVHIVAVPNAGRRSEWERLQRKREGMSAGFPDCLCFWHWAKVAAIEFKRLGGRLTTNQAEWIARLNGIGIPAIVAYTAEEALAFLRERGAPFLSRVNRL